MTNDIPEDNEMHWLWW